MPRVDHLKTRVTETIEEITGLLRLHLIDGSGIPPKVDARVEYLIANLYGLSETHYEDIYSTLNEVQDLVPIRPLKTISISDIFG